MSNGIQIVFCHYLVVGKGESGRKFRQSLVDQTFKATFRMRWKFRLDFQGLRKYSRQQFDDFIAVNSAKLQIGLSQISVMVSYLTVEIKKISTKRTSLKVMQLT